MLLRLVVTTHDGYVLIRATGEMDLSNAATVGDAVHDAIADGFATVLVSLSGVSFIDSTGLSALVQGHRAAEAQGGYLAVVSPSEQVLQVIQLLGADHLLHLYDSVDDALRRG